VASGIFTLVVLALAVVAPDDVGSGSFISHRLALFAVLGLLIWLSGQDVERRHMLAAAGVAVVAAAGLAVVRYDELRAAERISRDLAPALRCDTEGRTVVQGNLARVAFGSADRIDLFTNEASRGAAVSRGLDLLNVDLRAPQWLQRYREETSAATHLVEEGAFVVDVPPPFDFAAFERTTGTEIDHVLLWGRPGMSRETARSASLRAFERSLRARYRQESRSPEGWWELWVRRGVACV
jgi:hypothetical protein